MTAPFAYDQVEFKFIPLELATDMANFLPELFPFTSETFERLRPVHHAPLGGMNKHRIAFAGE